MWERMALGSYSKIYVSTCLTQFLPFDKLRVQVVAEKAYAGADDHEDECQ